MTFRNPFTKAAAPSHRSVVDLGGSKDPSAAVTKLSGEPPMSTDASIPFAFENLKRWEARNGTCAIRISIDGERQRRCDWASERDGFLRRVVVTPDGKIMVAGDRVVTEVVYGDVKVGRAT